jgi:uncharacterized protein (TIGR04255 family)
LLRRQIVFAEGDSKKIEEVLADRKDESIQKIWQFKSGKGVELNLSSRSLSITSDRHKTYLLGKTDRFRDVLASVLDQFFAITAIPLVSRVGLRYIDECPVPGKSTQQFRDYYNTAFSLDRFPIEQALSMDSVAVVSREGCQMRYLESLKYENEKPKLILDFDAWADNVAADKVLEVTDVLHQTISTEFEQTVKEPVLEFMRQPPEQ